MGGRTAGNQQRSELYVEPSGAGATIAACLVAFFLLAMAGAAAVYQRRGWPDELQLGLDIPDGVPRIAGIVAAMLAVACVVLAVHSAVRWHATRAAGRLKDDPALRPFLPAVPLPPPEPVAARIPDLSVDVLDPRTMARPEADWRPVDAEHNVIGQAPLRITYLQLFENQPRRRTFLEGAWREYGYVTLLRSAWSLSMAEFRSAGGALDQLFIDSPARLETELGRGGRRPNAPGRCTLRAVVRRPIHVRDPYGSYPVNALLCHRAFWTTAVDIVVARADIVVVDLAGVAPGRLGATSELRRVLDRVPIERVMFLGDPRTDPDFLRHELATAWRGLAARSPNAGAAPRRAVIAITDRMPVGDEPEGSRPAAVRLVARRRLSRKVGALALARATT